MDDLGGVVDPMEGGVYIILPSPPPGAYVVSLTIVVLPPGEYLFVFYFYLVLFLFGSYFLRRLFSGGYRFY